MQFLGVLELASVAGGGVCVGRTGRGEWGCVGPPVPLGLWSRDDPSELLCIEARRQGSYIHQGAIGPGGLWGGVTLG